MIGKDRERKKWISGKINLLHESKNINKDNPQK